MNALLTRPARPASVAGLLLNLDELRGIIHGELTAQGRDIDINEIEPEKAVLIYNQSGKPAVVNTEGVGSYAEDGGISVWYSIGFYLDSVDIEVETLEQATTHTEVQLNEFIRTFGDRLERNFFQWHSWSKN